jgi:hypothetical protein
VTLVSSIITDAYRESNMLPLGKVPTANQTTEALRLYNALIDAIYGGDAGERLTDWPLGNFERDPNGCDYIMPFSDHRLHHPPINQRLIAVNLARRYDLAHHAPAGRFAHGRRRSLFSPLGRAADYRRQRASD